MCRINNQYVQLEMINGRMEESRPKGFIVIKNF